MDIKRNAFKLILVIAAALLVSLTYFNNNGNSEINADYNSDATRLHFIDVGQGDCTLIESNGEYMLIDAGEKSEEEKVKSYLTDMDIKDFKYVIATHPHSDHIGSMAEVLNNFNVENIILPEVSANTATFERMADAILSNNINTIAPKVGDNYTLGDCSFTIIAPYSYDEKNLNNDSVGIKLVHGNDKFIFMGDDEKTVEKEIIEKGVDIKADLYKVSHHGSSTSSTSAFIKAISPKYAVISCGKDNEYGHPHVETLDKLKKLGANIYRTDESGDIIFESTGNGLECIKGVLSGASLAPTA